VAHAEILVFIDVADDQSDPVSASGLTQAAMENLEEAINALDGFALVFMRPTGPVMPTLPGGNTRVDFRAPPEAQTQRGSNVVIKDCTVGPD